MQKTAPNNTKYSKNETVLKISHLIKAIAHAKAVAFAKKMLSLTEKLKMQKKRKEPFWINISVVLWKKPLKKHQIFEKWDDFGNRPSCKGYSPCKGYSSCKMVSLGQKLKMPKTCEKRFCKSIRVVLCKKPFEKTPNIREMRRFWKSSILQRLQPMQRL